MLDGLNEAADKRLKIAPLLMRIITESDAVTADPQWKTKKKFGVVFPFPELTLVSNDVVNAWTCSNRWIKTTGFYMVLSSKLKLGRYQQYKMYTRFHHHGRCDVNTIKS